MGKVNFSDDFKRDAVAQITERGYPVSEVSERLGVSRHSLYAWKKKFSAPSGDDDRDTEDKAIEARTDRGYRGARHSKKGNGALRSGCKVKYAFVADHRPVFPMRAMCRCLRIHPSGFYAWLRNPLSKRAREDARQIELIRKARKESGMVYGYRKLHDDLLDQGETICWNRVVRLARQAGIKARIGYRRQPGSHGGKPSVIVGNTLDRQFDVEVSDKVWVTDITYIRTQEAEEQGGFHPFGSGFPVHQQGLGFIPEASQSGAFHEPVWQLSRQRGRGELLQCVQARTDKA